MAHPSLGGGFQPSADYAPSGAWDFTKATLSGVSVTSAVLTTPVLNGSSLTASGTALNDATQGVAAGYRLARGVTALDGSNPTTAATGLTTIVAAVACVQGTSAVSSGTAFVTVDFTGSDGNLNLYGWVLAGTASSGTESINWIAVGT
jgi:hypothetical protein